jgi:hypothetical protein
MQPVRSLAQAGHLFLVFLLWWSPASGQQAAELAASAERLFSHISYLAQDELGGRDSGEPGLEVAAEYIANRFREYGLEPAGDRGGYFQHFHVPFGADFGGTAGATLSLPGGVEIAWMAGADVEAFGFGDQQVVDAPLVFAGYGITAADEERNRGIEYDDFAGIDVKGKALIVFRYVPRSERAGNPFGGRRSRHAPFTAKLARAKEKGAAGVIFVTPPGADDEGIYGVAHRASPRQPTLPAVVADRGAVEELLALHGRSLPQLVEEIDRTLEPRSFELPETRIRFSTVRRHIRLRNVAARLHGSDPALSHQALVIGAHYDHIGRFGGQVAPANLGKVHNGADDNASGVAGLLELARLFAASGAPRRSLVFVCFSGEEIGLLGSRHWVAAPRRFITRRLARAYEAPPRSRQAQESGPGESAPYLLLEGGTALEATGKFAGGLVEVKLLSSGAAAWVEPSSLQQVSGPQPLHEVIAMINLDMIGRAKEDAAVSVLGAQSALEFPDLLEALSGEVQLPIKAGGGSFAGGSDHTSFFNRGIPVLFFFTGMHAQYNTPGDEAHTINVDAQRRIVDLVWRASERLASASAPPRFNHEALASAGGRGRGRPRLGVELDTRYSGPGVRVVETLADSPAARAGLRSGDLILRLGGEPVRSTEELLSAIERVSEGPLAVLIRRDGREQEVRVELPAARRGFRVRFGSVPDYSFGERGVRFEDIRPDTPAARAGVQPGDVLVRWGTQEIGDVEEWTRLLGEHQPGDKVRITVRRGGELLELEVRLEG